MGCSTIGTVAISSPKRSSAGSGALGHDHPPGPPTQIIRPAACGVHKQGIGFDGFEWAGRARHYFECVLTIACSWSMWILNIKSYGYGEVFRGPGAK